MTGSISTTYVYVNIFDPTDIAWDEIGDTPYLDSVDTNHRIEATIKDILESWFEFADLSSLGWLKQVVLELYCRCVDQNGKQYVRAYIHDGASEQQVTGDFPPNATWGWKALGIPNIIDTWAKINLAKLKLKKFTSGAIEWRDMPVDGFIDQGGWTRVGASPYLDVQDQPTNRIYTNTDNDVIGDFTFEDVPAEGWSGGTPITLYIFCVQEGTDETVDVEIWDGASWQAAGTITPNPVTFSYKTLDVSSILNSEAKLNAAKVRFTYHKSGAAHNVHIDYAYLYLPCFPVAEKVEVACARLRIDYYEDGEEITKDPTANEVETAGWNSPEYAHADGAPGAADSITIGAKQNYTTHNFDGENLEIVYVVYIDVDCWYSGVIPDALRVCISTDGGIGWTHKTAETTTSEATRILDFTADKDWDPSLLSNANFKTQIWAGSKGCLRGKCEVALWIENKNERNTKKALGIDVLRSDDMHELMKTVSIENRPKILAWSYKKKFHSLTVTEVKKHLNQPCYHIQVKEISDKPDEEKLIKDVEGSATEKLWSVFDGDTMVQDLKIHDCLCGLDWNDKEQDYRLMLMEITEHKFIGYHDVYEVITDSDDPDVHIFAHSTMKVVVKW